jgi:hypothetical protein
MVKAFLATSLSVNDLHSLGVQVKSNRAISNELVLQIMPENVLFCPPLRSVPVVRPLCADDGG